MENNQTAKTDLQEVDREGLLVVTGALVDRTLATTFAAVGDVVAEARTVLAATFDYGDVVSKSALRLGRKLGERIVDLGNEFALRGERATRGLVQAVRTTGSEALEAATQALTATPSAKPAPQPRAKA
jgi:hypothetical protein